MEWEQPSSRIIFRNHQRRHYNSTEILFDTTPLNHGIMLLKTLQLTVQQCQVVHPRGLPCFFQQPQIRLGL